MVEWNGGMEWWNGMVEWNGGMDFLMDGGKGRNCRRKHRRNSYEELVG